jgi:L-lactate dehydrogenase
MTGKAEDRKVAVVGAGQVGATFAFALTISGLASGIALIDRDRERAEGHVMDLNHGLSFVQPSKIYAGGFEECRGAHIVLITAGAAQKPGETRLDLAQRNTDIFKEIIPEIAAYDPGILIVVSNPVDVLTYVALEVSGYPMNRVIGSGTALDTSRFRYLLSRHCSVDPRNVHAYILGEHGDSEVPAWSQVNIAGIPFSEYCAVCGRHCGHDEKQELFRQVRDAGYQIIRRKGHTNFAIALAMVRIVSSILRDENSVLTVSTLVDDYYGIGGVCLSVPVILNRDGVVARHRIMLDDAEISGLKASARILREIVSKLRI